MQHLRQSHAQRVRSKQPFSRLDNLSCCIFLHRSSLRYHKQYHLGERNLCLRCGQAFSSKEALKRHEQHHGGEGEFACSYCDFRHSAKFYITRHEKVRLCRDTLQNNCSKMLPIFQVAHFGHITKNRLQVQQRWMEAKEGQARKELAEAIMKNATAKTESSEPPPPIMKEDRSPSLPLPLNFST